MIYKRANTWWFSFVYNGKRIQESTKIKVKGVRHDPTGQRSNKEIAKDIESAYRTQLAKGEVGIEEKPVTPAVPTFREFKDVFMAWVRDKKPNIGTQKFYNVAYERLCEFKEFSNAKLDEIDEPMIERFRLSVKDVSKTTVNRYLATLRKALRYACRGQKLIPRVPVVDLYTKEEGAERSCEYVYTISDYQAWLKAALEPLRSASILAYECGICRGELLALQRDCVLLRESPDENGDWCTIEIKRGLKRNARRRDATITEPMAAVLFKLMLESKCEYLLTSSEDRTKKLSANTLANQHRIIKKTCTFHPDAGLHALRHSFLTEAGRHTQNVRALQKLAGHSQIETTMRYIHPDHDDVMEIAREVRRARSKNLAGVTTIFTTPTQQEASDSRKI
jgi:integrase